MALSIGALVVAGGLIGWLYVAEVAKNLKPSTAAASAGVEQTPAVPGSDRTSANKASTDAASPIPPGQGLQDLAAGLEQVKQALQQERDRGDKESRRLAADLAQTQQVTQRETEQARHLAEGLATNLAQELAKNIEQVKQALQQQDQRLEKLASQLPMKQPQSDVAVAGHDGQPDGRLTAVATEVTQVRQAIAVVAADLDTARQALQLGSDENERKVVELATELTAAKEAARRDRDGADRRMRELANELAQLKQLVENATDRNASLARQTSADVAQIQDAVRHEIGQRVRAADELTAELAQVKLALRQLAADLATDQVKAKQNAMPEPHSAEHKPARLAAEFTIAAQPQQTSDGLAMSPAEANVASAGPNLLLAKRSDGMAGAEPNSPARLRDAPGSIPAPGGDRQQPVQPPSDTADTELERLLSRANLLISQGNIGAARIVLERASETGNGQALFALAETFDPVVLSAWGTLGTLGDATRAQELYAKALAGGVEEARSRLTR